MIEIIQISMFLLILVLSFGAFAVVLRAEAIKSGYMPKKRVSRPEKASQFIYRKSY
ncbi:hypothetical protein Q9251_20390 [Alkalihalobacillus macyae]|uniref:hypothetical protein n=1 Tax=Guptibacillus hwajinpoensis TaxID=208199 RepID=UPI00273C1BE2|nr:hypothetical protein [Alkalihalobacillus macyae]MDP4553229.1 hypothetical protein [Alkalihalobacillus macyae]